MFYPIAIEPGDKEHAYGVVVPDIPGCFSAGDSFEAAVIHAREAIEAHLELLFDDGLEIPQASDMKTYLNDPDFNGWVWALVEVDITPFLGKSQKVNVTLPDVLIKRIDDTVSRQPIYKSRSGFLAQAALHELGRITTV
jgi:predicted RNase H-like HicB family nuclease